MLRVDCITRHLDQGISSLGTEEETGAMTITRSKSDIAVWALWGRNLDTVVATLDLRGGNVPVF